MSNKVKLSPGTTTAPGDLANYNEKLFLFYILYHPDLLKIVAGSHCNSE